MAKILSVLTLIFALGATFLGFQSKGRVETLKAAADKEHADLATAKSDLKSAKDKLKTAEDETAQAKSDLDTAKEKLRTAETDLTKAKGDLTAATTELEQSKAKVMELEMKLAGMTPDGGDIKAKLAAAEAKVTELDGKVQTLEKEKAELSTTVETLSAAKKNFDEQLASQNKVIKRYKEGIMNQGIRGRVLAVNAGWGFCVLSIGDRQGAAVNKTMVVVRGGYSIGRVRISNVESSQSVADIIPSSFVRGTYIQPGDDVIYTKEDKARDESGGEASAAPATSNPTVLPVPALPQP